MAAQPQVQPLTDEDLAQQGLKVPGGGQIRSFAPTQLPTGAILTAPDKWPPPGCDMNELDDDDIAGAMRFAIPDFRAEERQLPEIDRERPPEAFPGTLREVWSAIFPSARTMR
ncbi:hypothetical protein Pmar_PMAR001254 [Perkinsus marinus ATCC 50983]|uniref:Uncharacterized protein n=1 Tax=Perkinsus marinus (strain ATCC 50983 / TXsc) TaxID=423536 RepID=C5KTA7_PERM5|nr:hypothetical protein Pmar_PMAR001254 [Perkinsus marinus ATCC 50983]EER12457.1 hypothetical protein Pmar_PMAR001254 [Perkinsus marinus ATCC 50983]|eukprot:XP_002780662.1 hypothetical protein Pmar_PMAR001254 [Perkinsus marinus ATCC 50983]